MKVEYDKKKKEIRYIPESDLEVFKLGRLVGLFNNEVGLWRYHLATGKIMFVSFNAVDILNLVLNNARPNPIQP